MISATDTILFKLYSGYSGQMNPPRSFKLGLVTLLVVTKSLTMVTTAKTCKSVQQNDAFLDILKTTKPVGVNVFAEYDTLSNEIPDMSYRPPGGSGPTFGENLGIGKFFATLTPKDPVVVNPPVSRCWIYRGRHCDPPLGQEDYQIVFSDKTDSSATMTVSNAPYNNGVSYLKWSSFQPDTANRIEELFGSYISPGGTASYNGYGAGREDSSVQFAVGNFDPKTGYYSGEESLNGVDKGEWFTFTNPN